MLCLGKVTISNAFVKNKFKTLTQTRSKTFFLFIANVAFSPLVKIVTTKKRFNGQSMGRKSNQTINSNTKWPFLKIITEGYMSSIVNFEDAF